MNTPPNRPAASRPADAQDPTRMRALIRLREELAELHAGLEYVKLLLKMGVGKR
jgi:hypothetical protein